MKENFLHNVSYKADHAAFGGRIYPKDFDRYTSMSEVVSRILSDQRFDQVCKQNREYKDKGKY